MSDDDIRELQISNLQENTALLKEQRQFYSHLIIYLKQLSKKEDEPLVEMQPAVEQPQQQQQNQCHPADCNIEATEAGTIADES